MIRIKDDGTVVEREEYKAILVGVSLGEDISYSLEELEGLAEAAGIETLGVMTQNAETINAATYIGKTIRCGTESEPSELIALTADRIYLIHVFHYGTKAYGGVNQREWVLESGTERRKEMNPLPALKDQRSMLQKLFTREKAGSVPMELLLVFSDTYGRTRFQLDGVTNALDIRDMNSWWKKRPARFSGRLDFAKVKQILDRSLA